MTNDLILIDGQEGFVDLALIEEWAIKEESYDISGYSELKTRASGYHTISMLSFQKKLKDFHLYTTKERADRLILIGMQISYRNLSRIFRKINHKIDERTKILKDKMNKAKTMITRNKYNHLIRKLIKEEEQEPEDYFKIIYRLLKKLPEKYHTREKTIIPLKGKGSNPYLECSIIKMTSSQNKSS